MAIEASKEWTTHSGIPVKDLYTPEDVKHINYERDLGDPGEPPFTRGVYKTMYRGRTFTIRRFTGVESPEQTNELYKEQMRLGQTGLAIAPDVPSTIGYDSDNPRVVGDVGFCGVPICTMDDMETIFKDIAIDKITCWTYDVFLTALYFVMAEKNGYDMKKIGGSTPGLRYIQASLLDRPGHLSIEGEKRVNLDFIQWTSEHVPQWHSSSMSVYAVKDNGFNNIQEVGYLISAVIQTVDDWKAKGLPMENFFRRIAFEMAIANDFFEEICTLRAARRVWTKICRERYGITDPKLMQFRVRVQTSGSNNYAQEPLNNIVRIAYHMLAGCLGGAQAMHPNGYDEALCIPTDQSMLISIRTLQILSEETNVTATIDPLGGSYYVEWLTSEIEKRAWEYYEKIEAMGGHCEAVRKGFFMTELKKANYDWDHGVDTGTKVVIGVNKYRMKPEEVPYKVPIYKFVPTAGERQIAKVTKYKKERDNVKVKDALKKLDKACRLEHENIFPYIMDCFRAGATIQEPWDVCREVYGLETRIMTM